MKASPTQKLEKFVGKSLDGLNLSDRWTIAGSWIATEHYSPKTLPLRLIQAIGTSAIDCITQLKRKGLDPEQYEYTPVPQPYTP